MGPIVPAASGLLRLRAWIWPRAYWRTVAHPWLVPPADFNPEGISWAIKSEARDTPARVVALYECTTSEPAGIELSEWEIPATVTEADAVGWLAGYMPDAEATRISRAMLAALAEQ